MKTIFITGASSGIGKETAILFSSRGWRVIATMRNPQRGKDLMELSNIEIMRLDISKPEEIRSTCKEAIEKYDIDILFNNAGYGIMGAMERIPEDIMRELFDTDVIGTMLVTQEFIPHFKKRCAGGILTTTSLAGIIALPRDGVYGAAKRAQESMVETLYYELKPFGVFSKSIIPGGTKTNFQTPFNDRTGYEEPAANQRAYLLNGNEEFPGPEEAAEIVWQAVNDGKDQVRYCSDSVCQELYDQYIEMGYENFKDYFYNRVFEGK